MGAADLLFCALLRRARPDVASATCGVAMSARRSPQKAPQKRPSKSAAQKHPSKSAPQRHPSKPTAHSTLRRVHKSNSFMQMLSGDAEAPEDELAKEMTHDLEMNFNKIAPFGKEDTAKELQDHAASTQNTLVDAVENAEVAEIKRAVFRALTRL